MIGVPTLGRIASQRERPLMSRKKTCVVLLSAFVQSIAALAHATIVTAVGSNGTIIQSLDSGVTWTPQLSNNAPSLTDVDFIDGHNGWAIGDSLAMAPTVRKTVNGGQNWQVVTVPPIASQPGHGITGVHFVNANVGWLIGNPGLVFDTTDDGATWGQQSNGVPASDLHDLNFVDSNNGWIVGDDGRGLILRTTDGGANWHTQFTGASGEVLLGVDFVDSNTGWTVGTSVIRHTTDGGATWNIQAGGYLRDVEFVDAMTGWAVGKSGVIVHTTDGGVNWVEQFRFANSNNDLNAVDFISRDEGWAAGGAGTILHTINGGATWLPQTTGTDATLYGLSAVPEPSTLALAAFGVFGLLIAARRRR